MKIRWRILIRSLQINFVKQTQRTAISIIKHRQHTEPSFKGFAGGSSVSTYL